MMAAGAALGFGGVELPWVELGIAASVLVLGAAVALRAKPSLAVSVPLIAAFALLHGYSHGVELPGDVSALTYAAGFIAATAVLHLVGIGLGLAANRDAAAFRDAGGWRCDSPWPGSHYLWSRTQAAGGAAPGKISDLMTTGTAPDVSSIAPMSM